MDPEWLTTVHQAVARTDPLVGDLDVLEDGGPLLEFGLHPLQQRGQCSSSHIIHLLFIAVEEERLLAIAKFADLILFLQLVPSDDKSLPGRNLLVGIVSLLLPDACALVCWAYVFVGGLLLKVQQN